MYSTLIYGSIRQPNCNKSEIENILAAANQNNPKVDVTGVLLYNQNKFLQYLEGDSEQILDLYNSISMDKRHKNIIMISYKKDTLDHKLFPKWAMGGNDLNDGTINYQSKLNSREKETFNSLLLSDTNINTTNSIKVLRKLFN